MRTGKTNTWRGLRNPTRGRCPKCQRKGLGPLKVVGPNLIGRCCRYCTHVETTGN